jgi:signal peptidase II
MRILATLLAGGVFTLDLISKWWVKTSSDLVYYPVVDGFVTIQHVRNTGIAFGLFNDLNSPWKPFVLSAIAVAAVVAVIFYLVKTPSHERLALLSLGLLLGGILGNFTDRILNAYVFDFITLHWKDAFTWPTFNLADASISTGVFLLVLQSLIPSAKRIPSATACLIALSLVGTVRAQTDDSVVRRLQQRYDRIESLTARFEQTFTSRGISNTETGIVMMKRPGKMYWEYQQPTKKFFVADGEKTFFYVPKDNQVLVSELDLENSNSPLMFLFGKGDIERDFLVSSGSDPSKPQVIQLRLTPRQPNPEFSYVVLEVASESYLVRRLIVVEPIGQQNEYRLEDLRENVQIPDQRFKLDIPSKVEFIEQ